MEKGKEGKILQREKEKRNCKESKSIEVKKMKKKKNLKK